MGLRSYLSGVGTSLCFVGLVFGAMFFALSLSPSLVPRNYLAQGLLGGLALVAGYGVGVVLVWLWSYLELREPQGSFRIIARRALSIAVLTLLIMFLWRASTWQNSIRELMEMEPVTTARPFRVSFVALAVSIALFGLSRAVHWVSRRIARQVIRFVPRRMAYVISGVTVVVLSIFLINGVLIKYSLRAADAVFLELDEAIDEGIAQPENPHASGSNASLIPWETIGRRGKNFVAGGPTMEQLKGFWGRETLRPLRVYVGFGSRETPEERAKLALAELIRVKAFERSLVVVATPTGTGWLDPAAVDTLEYLHAGDTAIVAAQYSYLPSWMTLMVDPQRARIAARTLFNEIYPYWTRLPKDRRPKLYLHGLSLGALGSEAAADLITVLGDPFHGAVWSGPPFPSRTWAALTRARVPGSPAWLPRFRDGSMFRFTGRQNALKLAGAKWGPMRIVYLQHASDPMSFFAPEILYRKPGWLAGKRGPDVSPYIDWYPIVTFLQIGFDLPLATSVPIGYGHNYAPDGYINAWIEVTQPNNWGPDDTARLNRIFVEN